LFLILFFDPLKTKKMKKLLLAAILLNVLVGCQNASESEKTETTETTLKTQSGTFPVSQQQVFCLSMVSNLPAAIAWPYDDQMGQDANLYADSIIVNIAPFMDATLQNATDTSGGQNLTLSNWTRVWGPAVIVDTNCSLCTKVGRFGRRHSYVPVSSMTIFKDNNNNYVVGVEATNAESMTDWKVLDLNVFSSVPFNSSDASQGSLTQGTSIGLNQYLLQLKDMSTGQSAFEYLKTRIDSANSVIVTGHSLGGALSPVYALYLKQNLNTDKIYCLATAGASPGDMTFINYFNNQMGSQAIRVWNKLDVVPHAWEPDTMDLIKSIYETPSASIAFDAPFACNGKTKPSVSFNSLPTPTDIKVVVDKLVSSLKSKNLVYGSICNGGQTFSGTQQSSALYYNTAVSANPSLLERFFPNDISFITQLGNQHIAAYIMFFNMKGIHEYMRDKINSNTIKNSVAWRSCDEVTCDCSMLESSSASEKNAQAIDTVLDEKTIALWGLIHQYAWGWH
jgi:hypothetical protein